MANLSQFRRFLTSCVSCGSSTSKAYARANSGKCKACVTGQPRAYPEAKERTYKQIHGRCEDAPCCGCCGPNSDDEQYHPNDLDNGNAW